MKIKIEIDDNLTEEEITIRTSCVDERIGKIQRAIKDAVASEQKFAFCKGETTYYLGLDDVLFFETADNTIYAHTESDVYGVRYRLYELEELLPMSFMRVSKSTILNIRHIYAMTRALSSCLVEFRDTHKQVYVSRHYYKPLKNRLEEKR